MYRVYNDDDKQAAFENACDCLYYGFSRKYWNSCGLSEQDADEVWKRAIEHMTRDD